MYSGMTIPEINEDIVQISCTLGGHKDLVLHIRKRGVFWATELFHTSVPRELGGTFIGPDALIQAIEAYNKWKAKNGNQSPANNPA